MAGWFKSFGEFPTAKSNSLDEYSFDPIIQLGAHRLQFLCGGAGNPVPQRRRLPVFRRAWDGLFTITAGCLTGKLFCPEHSQPLFLAEGQMTRVGKIARLPREIREQLNHRLQDGEIGKRLVDWLNSLPEVKAVLAGEFNGRADR